MPTGTSLGNKASDTELSIIQTGDPGNGPGEVLPQNSAAGVGDDQPIDVTEPDFSGPGAQHATAHISAASDHHRKLVHALLDVALLSANSSQLMTLLKRHDTNNSIPDALFVVSLVLIVTSMSLQVVIACLLIAIWHLEKANWEKQRQKEEKASMEPLIARAVRTVQSVFRSPQADDTMDAATSDKDGECCVEAKLELAVMIGIMLSTVINIAITGMMGASKS